MVQTEKVQNRGVPVVDVAFVLHGDSAMVICCTITDTALDSTTRHPRCIAFVIMVTSVSVLSVGSSAEFTAPDHQRVLQQSSLGKVCQQACDRLIDFGTSFRKICLKAIMMIPVSVCDFHKSNTGFHKAAGHQALASEGVSVSAVDSVQPECLLRFCDILREISTKGPDRPRLVVGFAAETERVIEHAQRKLAAKGCDWIVANDVSPASGVMGGDKNTVHIVSSDGVESWPELDKDAVARALVARAAERLSEITGKA